MKDRARQWWWWCLTVVVVVVVDGVEAQRTKSCDVTPSISTPGKKDVYCNCMQRLEKVDVAVASLTINQTGCAAAGLEVSWPALEAEVGPERLVLAGARIYFAENVTAAPWRPSITSITFFDCTFLEVPRHAFRGLQLLEEVHVLGGAVGVVRSGAFSDLPRLRLMEVANASLSVIEGGAWASLPALTHLAIWHCSVGEIKPHAVNLTRSSDDGGPAAPGGEACGEAREAAEDHSRLLEVVAGRRSPGDDSVTLPPFGTQLLLFNNNIQVLAPRALSGDAFGFLIMGSNVIGSVGGAAFDLALNNPCEISAALMVGNTMAGLDDGALAGLRGWKGAPRRTFLALTKNTFSSVAPHAFTLHQSLHIFSVEENHFRCSCSDLRWAAPAATEGRRDLKEMLLAKGECQDGTNLTAFIAACTNTPKPPSPSIIPPPPPSTHTPTHHDHTTPSLSPSHPPTTTPPSTPSPSPNTTPSPSHDTTPITPPTPTLTPEPPLPSGAPSLAHASSAFITLLLARTLL